MKVGLLNHQCLSVCLSVTQISADVKMCILRHHCSLKSHFENYFPDVKVKESRYTPWRRLGGEEV
jgi:hypothetical protein